MKEEQKMDSMSKILLATSTINYMANTVNAVIKDYQLIITVNSSPESNQSDFSKKAMSDGLEQKTEFMDDIVKRLSEIVEEMGNFLNGCDMVCPIDERVNRIPCEILLLGMDSVEEYYDNGEAPFS